MHQKESLLVCSSTVEPSTVNRMVTGSNPVRPANLLKTNPDDPSKRTGVAVNHCTPLGDARGGTWIRSHSLKSFDIKRMKQLALKPRYPDCTFFNVQTQQPCCTFNQCVSKFEPCDYVVKTAAQRGRPYAVKQRYFYRCKECGRTVEDKAPETLG